jgi:hypothetical protein
VPPKKPKKKKQRVTSSFIDDEAEDEDDPSNEPENIFHGPNEPVSKKKYTLRDHYSYQHCYRAEEACNPDNEEDPELGMFSPIHHGGRLAQQYFVDSYAKIEEDACHMVRRKQKQIRAEMYIQLKKHLETRATNLGVEPGKVVVLPSTFVGSPRYMQLKYNEATCISMHTGSPDKFITMTANANWPEVLENLLPGQTPADRPDLIARVFKLKLDELLRDLLQRHIFGEVAGYAWTIEYQKRGLPHVHILLVQKHSEDKAKTGPQIDLMVSAEIPNKQIDKPLYDAVCAYMIHGPCGDYDPNCPCMKNEKCPGKCYRFFPFEYCQETVADNKGYPVYMRRKNQQTIDRLGKHTNITSQWVVPYNPYLLLKYQCHLNVEICTSIKSFKYIYKYIFKGGDRTEVKFRKGFQDAEEVSFLDKDEIKDFMDCRYLSSHEALWRTFGFHTNAMSHCVETLPVHLPGEQQVLFPQGTHYQVAEAPPEETKLTAFFHLNAGGVGISPVARDLSRTLTYDSIPKHFTWENKTKSWKIRSRLNIKIPWCPSGIRPIIGRMHIIFPAEMERYCLRLLLHIVKGPESYEALRTHEGVVHPTFHLAAIAKGLLKDDNEWDHCLTEAAFHILPDKMIYLFATILLHCAPSNPLRLWNDHKMSLIKPNPQISDSQQLHKAYHSLNRLLQNHSETLSMQSTFHIPPPEGAFPPEPIPAEPVISVAEANRLKAGLNQGQREAFDKIEHSYLNQTGKCYFIDGPGGTGKTYLYQSLIASAQSKGKTVVVVASTGIAATLLNGITAHKAFDIPLVVAHDTVSNMKSNSKQADHLRKCSLIIWDESTASHRYHLEILDKLLRDLLKSDLPFAGKTIALGGDFRQTLPIVLRGSGSQQVAASIRMSPLWDHFETLILTENMRAKDSPEWAEWLLKVGDGLLGENMLLDPRIYTAQDFQDLIHSTFGHLLDEETLPLIRNNVILSPLNSTTLAINEKILKMIASDNDYRKAIDTPVDKKEDHQIHIPVEFMKTLTPPGMPQHTLNIKVGAVYMLLRNLNVKQGLCNGSRLIILEKFKHSLKCELIPPSPTSEPPLQFMLPRITLTSPEQYPFAFARHQFPIRPAFAVTINKAQGSTYNRVGINLTKPVFSHGQLYVALSRVRNWNSVSVLLPEDETTTQNIVWHNIFDRSYIDRRIRECHPPNPTDMEYDDSFHLHPEYDLHEDYEIPESDFDPPISQLDQFLNANPSYMPGAPNHHFNLPSILQFPSSSDEEIPEDHWDHD